MIKNLIIILLFLIFTTKTFSAGSDDNSSKVKSNYDQAVVLIKSAKKLEKKGKTEKANKKYEKAQKLLIKSNNKKPNQPDTLNYLGFTTRKLGDFENGEKYYLCLLYTSPSPRD